MKKTFLILFTSLAISSFGLSVFAIEYQTLAPIENKVPTSITIDESYLSTYLNNLYILGIMICSGLAVLMIVIGGVQWASSDAWSKKSEGKDRIWSAVIGLVIALGSFVILNTIDTNLVDIKLEWGTIAPVDSLSSGSVVDANGNVIPQSPTDPTNPGSDSDFSFQLPPAGKSEEEVRAYMTQNGIGINNANPCVPPQTKGCTNLAGLGTSAMTGVVALKKASGASVTITGGTESGHLTHGVGKSIVDLRFEPTLDNYIISNSSQSGSWYTMPNGDRYLKEGDHWHVEFK